jgi:crotonobetainyl-CoA:carnitine CoA-transferase CaiB-like acyl-CoA transferase
VFACAGDDEWCVIDARTEDELAELAAAVRAGEGTAPGRELTAAIARWTATRTPADVMELLQARGVPAGAMLRSSELPVDPQLRHRGTFTTLRHPAIGDNLPAESAAAPYARLPASQQRPAPMRGEHTREICHELLGMDHGQIDDLASRGVLQELPASTNLPR